MPILPPGHCSFGATSLSTLSLLSPPCSESLSQVVTFSFIPLGWGFGAWGWGWFCWVGGCGVLLVFFLGSHGSSACSRAPRPMGCTLFHTPAAFAGRFRVEHLFFDFLFFLSRSPFRSGSSTLEHSDRSLFGRRSFCTVSEAVCPSSVLQMSSLALFCFVFGPVL